MEDCAMNTDREIWRRVPGDYYSPSIHVTSGGGIGMNCGGHVIVAPVEAWHECGEKLLCVNERLPSWKWRLAMWCLRTPEIRGLRPKEKTMSEQEHASGARVPCISLLGCPFCGGKARFADHEGGEWIECSECTASTVCMYPDKTDVKELLAERWNVRHPNAHADGLRASSNTVRRVVGDAQ